MKKWLLLLPFLFLPFMSYAQVVGPGFVDYVTSAPSGSCSSNAHQRNVMGLGTVYTCQSGTWAQISGGGGGCAQGTCVVNAPTSDQTIIGAHALILNNTGSSLAVGPIPNAQWLTVGGATLIGFDLTADAGSTFPTRGMLGYGGGYPQDFYGSSQGTLATPTATLANDELWEQDIFGYDGTEYRPTFSVEVVAENTNWSVGVTPADYVFFNNGTGASRQLFALLGNTDPGAVLIGNPLFTSATGGKLEVAGRSSGIASIVTADAAGTPTLTLPTTTGTFATTATSPLVLNATTGALTCPTCNVTSSTAGGALTGTFPNPTIANLGTGGTPGPVPYTSAAGTLSEDASNFCWDVSVHRMLVGTCTSAQAAPGYEFASTSSSARTVLYARNNGTGGISLNINATASGGLFPGVMNTAGTDWTNGLARAGYVMAQSALQFGAGNSAVTHTIQTNGHEQINTTTDPGGSIWLAVNGGIQGSTYNTNSNCANAASPAVCAAAPAGVVAVPTGTNPTLTINTTAVTANSNIFLQIDESSTIAATTCNTTLSTLVQPVVTARVAATSFTIQIGAVVASNPVCVSYHIIN